MTNDVTEANRHHSSGKWTRVTHTLNLWTASATSGLNARLPAALAPWVPVTPLWYTLPRPKLLTEAFSLNLEMSKRWEGMCEKIDVTYELQDGVKEKAETQRHRDAVQRARHPAPINLKLWYTLPAKRAPVSLSQVKGCSDGAPALSAQTILDYLHIPLLWSHLWGFYLQFTSIQESHCRQFALLPTTLRRK